MRRIPELDGLRGLASLAVVMVHLRVPYSGALGSAVDLFFVLSGYLITSIILKSGDSDRFLVNFYLRRGLRIWPIYYLAIGFLLLVRPLLHDPGMLVGLPYYVTYTQELPQLFLGSERPFIYAFRHTWTLAIEEQFYLIWPALVILVGARGLVPLSLGLASLAVGSRLLGLAPWVLLSRCDGFALGGLLAWLLPSHIGALNIRGSQRNLTGIGLIGLIITLGTREIEPLRASLLPLGVGIVYMAVVGFVVIGTGSAWLKWLRSTPLLWLGQVSYGLYLYHHMIFVIVDDALAASGIPRTFSIDAAKLAASLLISGLSWSFIERPILSLKDYFKYEDSTVRGNVIQGPVS